MNESAPVHSVQNSMVKHAFSLKNPKKIKDAEDFLCEGFHLVGEAFASGLNLRFIFATPEAQTTDEGRKLFELSKKEKTRWIPVNSKIIAYVSDTTTPQGILAVAQKPAARRPSQPLSLILCLDRLQDAGNVGTLFRSAEAFGAQGVLLTEGCCDIFNPKVVRSSMGSIFRVPFQTNQSGGKRHGLAERTGCLVFGFERNRRIVPVGFVPAEGHWALGGIGRGGPFGRLDEGLRRAG